jgi:hypothetical protein
MPASRKLFSSLAAIVTLGALTACDVSEPFTGAKDTLLGKPAPSPDLPENAKLYIPPRNAPLPPPGQGTNRQWPAAADGPQQQAAAAPPKKDDSGWFSGIFGSSDKQSQ